MSQYLFTYQNNSSSKTAANITAQASPRTNNNIPLIKPNIALQLSIASQKKKKRKAAFFLILACIVILAVSITFAVMAFKNHYYISDFQQSDLLFIQGNTTFYPDVSVEKVNNIDSFNYALANNTSMSVFNSVSMKFSGEYKANISDQSIATIVDGKIYGLKEGETKVIFTSPKGTYLSTRTILVK